MSGESPSLGNVLLYYAAACMMVKQANGCREACEKAKVSLVMNSFREQN